MSIKIQVNQTVERQRLADLLCGALEGGSTYWAVAVDCSWKTTEDRKVEAEWAHEAIALGATFAVVHDDWDTTTDVWPTDIIWAQTLEMFAEQYPRHFGDMMGETDDAETSDILFQLLCFGEVVYG